MTNVSAGISVALTCGSFLASSDSLAAAGFSSEAESEVREPTHPARDAPARPPNTRRVEWGTKNRIPNLFLMLAICRVKPDFKAGDHLPPLGSPAPCFSFFAPVSLALRLRPRGADHIRTAHFPARGVGLRVVCQKTRGVPGWLQAIIRTFGAKSTPVLETVPYSGKGKSWRAFFVVNSAISSGVMPRTVARSSAVCRT